MRHTTVPPHVPGHRLPRVCSRDALRDQVEAERCIIIICPLSKVGSQVINWGGGRDILDVAHLAHNPLWHMSSRVMVISPNGMWKLLVSSCHLSTKASTSGESAS